MPRDSIPEESPRYSIEVKMIPVPWTAAIIVFEDGQANINRSRAHPDSPVTVHVEGFSPNQAQLATLRLIWRVLSHHYNFTIISLCPALLPHCREIMGVKHVP